MLSEEEKSESANSETEGSQDVAEVKEVEEVVTGSENNSPNQETVQDENDSEGSLSTFSYDQLKAKSDNPVTGIDFKRREVGSIANALTSYISLLLVLKSSANLFLRPIFQMKSSKPYSGLQRKPSINCQSGSKTCRRRNLICFEAESA